MNLGDSGDVKIIDSPEYKQCADGTVIKGKSATCPEDLRQTSGFSQGSTQGTFHLASNKPGYKQQQQQRGVLAHVIESDSLRGSGGTHGVSLGDSSDTTVIDASEYTQCPDGTVIIGKYAICPEYSQRTSGFSQGSSQGTFRLASNKPGYKQQHATSSLWSVAKKAAIPYCFTISGPMSRKKCIFPFRYDGVLYNQCIYANHDKLWCSTQTDGNDNHIIGNWGNCGLCESSKL